MGATPRKRLSGLVLALSAISISYATAQEIPPMQSAWSSWGVLPFSAVDIAVVKTGDTYVMYYTTRPIQRESDPIQPAAPVPARAFSRDLKNWDVDPDVCRTSGELCSPGDPFGALGHRPIVQLRDGRYRMFRKNGDSIVSLIFADALTWTREAGARFTRIRRRYGSGAPGGMVYRRTRLKQLTGLMIFGDNPSGEVFYVHADKLPNGGQHAIRRILFADGGESKTLLQLIRAKNAAQGRPPASRADLRFGEGPDGQVFILNKRDGVIRVLVP